MSQVAPPEPTLAAKLKKLAHNIKFKLNGLLNNTSFEDVLRPTETLYLLGLKYQSQPHNNAELNSQIQKSFKSVIWITYRSKFPGLAQSDGGCGELFSDAGWGCMIRVGQMAFAEIIKTFRKSAGKEELLWICDLFNDCTTHSLFSIQNIARVGMSRFGLRPGDWYNLSEIAYILSDLLNQSKLKQLAGLVSLVFNDSTLFFDQILSAFSPQQLNPCSHLAPGGLVCTQCFASQKQVAVVIMSRLGLKFPEPQYLQVLDVMMEWRWFRGLMGGRSQSALYFLGRKHNEYIYLDPHYVQNASQDVTSIGNTYFCESWRTCKNTTIDASLGICFHLDSLHSLNQFYCTISELKKQAPGNFFIFMADHTPEYVGCEGEMQKEMEESCQFQLI